MKGFGLEKIFKVKSDGNFGKIDKNLQFSEIIDKK